MFSTVVMLKIQVGHTAVSRKVGIQKCKGVRNNNKWYFGGDGSLLWADPS